jgi:DNA-binding transcriptional LysR family regulator
VVAVVVDGVVTGSYRYTTLEDVTGLVERIVEYERLIVAVPAGHRLANCEEIGISEIRDEPRIVFPPSEGSSLREAGIRLAQTAGYTPNIRLEAPDSYSILALVGAGLGISITLSSVTGAASPDVRFVPLAGAPTYLAATMVHSAQASATTQHVLRFLEDELETPERPDGIIFE